MSESSGFNWFERVIGTFTFWAILGNIVVILLEMIPLLGSIFAALLAVTRLAFVLPHLITVALIMDVKTGQLRWPLLLIPVFLYGSYYVSYFNQQSELAAYAAQQRSANPALVMQYDPAAHDIVFTDSRDEAIALPKAYKVPVTYFHEMNTPKAFRPMSSGLCEELRAAGVYKPALGGDDPRCDLISYYSLKAPSVSANTARIFEWFEKTTRKPIEISTNDAGAQKGVEGASLDLQVREKIYRFSYESKEIGRFVTASYIPLPPVPAWTYVCFMWERLQCNGTFYSNGREVIDTFPAKFDRAVHGDNPVGGLLGLVRYADKQMSDFQPFAETEAIGRGVLERKKNETPDDFNKWGIRKDDPRLPEIGARGGVPSYVGGIYTYKLGGPFYDFIRENGGRVVYIEGTLDGGNGNPSSKGFGLYGVCPREEECGSVDHRYVFTDGGGSTWNRATYSVKGYWQVGAQKQNGEDTTTDLTGIQTPQ